MSEWKTVTFGDCARRVSDVVQPYQMDEHTPYIGLEHIIEGGLYLNGHGNASDATSAKTRFYSGDILFGKLRPYFRKVVRPKFDGICSTDIWAVRAKKGIDQGFLFYRMASQDFIDISMGASTGTRMPRADWRFLSQWKLRLPPLPEQKAIAAVLGAFDDKIESNRRMNAALEAMARALFQSWFIDFDPVRRNADRRGQKSERGKVKREMESSLNPPNFNFHPSLFDSLFPDSFQDSELGPIPKGCEVKKLGEVLELAYGKPLKAENRKAGPICVYGANGPVGCHDRKLASGPGIIVGRKGNPGVVTWAHDDFYPIDTTFYVKPKDEYRSLYFLFYALLNHDLANLSADSAVPGLNRNHAYMSQQVMPPAPLLNAFDKQVEPIFTSIHTYETQSRTLATLRDTLLPKLLTGELSLMKIKKEVPS